MGNGLTPDFAPRPQSDELRESVDMATIDNAKRLPNTEGMGDVVGLTVVECTEGSQLVGEPDDTPLDIKAGSGTHYSGFDNHTCWTWNDDK
jgi:hypothetical protein